MRMRLWQWVQTDVLVKLVRPTKCNSRHFEGAIPQTSQIYQQIGKCNLSNLSLMINQLHLCGLKNPEFCDFNQSNHRERISARLRTEIQ